MFLSSDFLRSMRGLFLREECLCCARLIDNEEQAGEFLGRELCAKCAQALSAPWQRIDTGQCADVAARAPVPVFAAGAYGGPRRTLVLSAKDRCHPGAIRLMGRVFYAGLQQLSARGLLADPRSGQIALLPAPTRKSAAKKRGGDVVTRAALETRTLHQLTYPQATGDIGVFQVGYLRESARDSANLGRAERWNNIARSLVIDAARARRVREFVGEHEGRSECASVSQDWVSVQQGQLLAKRHRQGLLQVGEPISSSVVIIDDVCTTGATSAQYAAALESLGVHVAAILVIASG